MIRSYTIIVSKEADVTLKFSDHLKGSEFQIRGPDGVMQHIEIIDLHGPMLCAPDCGCDVCSSVLTPIEE